MACGRGASGSTSWLLKSRGFITCTKTAGDEGGEGRCSAASSGGDRRDPAAACADDGIVDDAIGTAAASGAAASGGGPEGAADGAVAIRKKTPRTSRNSYEAPGASAVPVGYTPRGSFSCGVHSSLYSLNEQAGRLSPALDVNIRGMRDVAGALYLAQWGVLRCVIA